MHIPASLRPQEEVIEEFGVSVKYTILLVIIGVIIVGFDLFVRFALVEMLSRIVVQLGIFGSLFTNGVMIVVALVGLYLIGLGLFFRVAYRYFFTNERVIESVGFFSQQTVSAEYKHMTDLIVRQDPISHLILNTGTLAINTAGGPKEEIVLTNIDNPTARREQVRGLAAATLNGKKITRELLRQLKRQTGMLSEDPQPQAVENNGITPAVLPEDVLSVAIPESLKLTINTDEGIEDLRGDGIDDSDRLRAKQKKLNL
jgi:hypothetical protein